MDGKRFSYTLLRPTPELIQQFDKVPGVCFNIYGYEVGKISGILHLQGYLEIKDSMNLWKLKSILKGFYIEYSRTSREQNVLYCKKNGIVKVYDPYNYLTSIN